MAQAAGALEVDLSALKKMKRAGCDAFTTANRVDSEKLLKWAIQNLFSESDLPKETYAQAQTREKIALADAAEVEAAKAKGTAIPHDEVVAFIRENFSPLREKVVAMPGQLAALVNPTDPQHARTHLELWRDEFLRQKEKLPAEPIKEEKKCS